MSATCRFDGCTVDLTNACALENDPATCPNRIGTTTEADKDQSEALEKDSIGDAVLSSPRGKPGFPASRTLGVSAIEELMRTRYISTIGILGDPASGKTACLASLYLLVANAKLTGWSFADSKSLMGFEEISRGARAWNEGNPPEQLTVHTEMADERSPGFLHLKLRREQDGRGVDLALPDLPGEWTKELVRSAVADRFAFLGSADAIWIVVDGRTLDNQILRQGVITRLGQLVGRLAAILPHRMPKLLLVITHRDMVQVSDDILARIAKEFAKHSAMVQVIAVAPFSSSVDTPAGFGLAELINSSVEPGSAPGGFWPASNSLDVGRAFLAYRRNQ